MAGDAYESEAKPWAIGFGSALSDYLGQAYMTQATQPKPTDVVLEIGTGSGYAAAVLARLAKEVHTVERHAVLAEGAGRIGSALGTGAAPDDIAAMIDHTLLKADATRDEVVALCAEAKQHRFASVCVNTTWVGLCKSLLAGTDVMVCCVVGFPLGAMTPTAKAYEARDAVRQGAREIDMVINLGALKSKDYETVFEDICRVVKAAAPAGVKVILETSTLDHDQKVIGCTLSKLAGAAFVKTSTGFAKGGATVEDVALMRAIVGTEIGVKASGGVRTAEDALRMAQAGANRIGASASVAIVTGKTEGDKKGY